jgi:hypothetical protein
VGRRAVAAPAALSTQAGGVVVSNEVRIALAIELDLRPATTLT